MTAIRSSARLPEDYRRHATRSDFWLAYSESALRAFHERVTQTGDDPTRSAAGSSLAGKATRPSCHRSVETKPTSLAKRLGYSAPSNSTNAATRNNNMLNAIFGALLPVIVTLLLGVIAGWRHDEDSKAAGALNVMVLR